MNEITLLFVLAGLSVLIQLIAFIPAYLRQTEHFYDLVGASTYLILLATAGYLAPSLDAIDLILLFICGVWALRLGSFLMRRVHVVGFDVRFNEIKKSFSSFLIAWSVQGLWVFFTLCPVLIVLLSAKPHVASVWTWIGLAIWVLGFSVEVTADQQKWVFKANPKNKGQFIQTGLWAYSRHPNYAGEITLWVGVFVACAPMLTGWQWIGVISPLFIYFLLTRISGIPILERNADARWGNDPAYIGYKKNTPVLWINPRKVIKR
jgi:steroid 5-alpha reductase family enzyme